MTKSNDLLYIEDAIDLREFILTLWRKKWIIFVIMFLFGMVAFMVSRFLVSEKFEAEAFISITEPTLTTELETSIQANMPLVDSSGLPGLAESTALKDLTFSAIGVTDYEDQHTIQFSASMLGTGQLSLMITAEDPNQAADAANAWAGVLTKRLNELYRTDQETIDRLDHEVSQAREKWSESQLALEVYLSESQLNSADIKLAAARSMLMNSLQEIDHNQLLLSDIQALLEQVEDSGLTGSLSTGTVLSILTLQQRAAAAHGEDLVQFLIEPSMKTDLTSAEAIQILLQLRDALENQNQMLGEVTVSLEDEIIDLARFLEQEQYRVDQLTEERDLARQAYTALRSQLEETRIIQAQEESWPLISAQALAPRESVGPNVLLYTVLASLLGLFACVMFILFRDWWNLEEV